MSRFEDSQIDAEGAAEVREIIAREAKAKEKKMTTEVLPPVLSKPEATKLENETVRHLDRFTANGFLLAVDIRKLYDGGVHQLRGYTKFGDYIEAKFHGKISGENAKKISLLGKVIIELQQANRVTFDRDSVKEGTELVYEVLGTTGARSLSTIQTKLGTGSMLDIYDQALAIAKENGSVITNTTIEAIVNPPLPEKLPEPEEETSEEEGEYQADYELSEEEHRLLDLAGMVEWNLLKLMNLIEEGGSKSHTAAAHLRDIVEETEELNTAWKERKQ